MIKNEFLNCLVVNLTNGRFGNCHIAMNSSFYAWWSFLFPCTRDIVATRACMVLGKKEVEKIENKFRKAEEKK